MSVGVQQDSVSVRTGTEWSDTKSPLLSSFHLQAFWWPWSFCFLFWVEATFGFPCFLSSFICLVINGGRNRPYDRKLMKHWALLVCLPPWLAATRSAEDRQKMDINLYSYNFRNYFGSMRSHLFRLEFSHLFKSYFLPLFLHLVHIME